MQMGTHMLLSLVVSSNLIIGMSPLTQLAFRLLLERAKRVAVDRKISRGLRKAFPTTARFMT